MNLTITQYFNVINDNITEAMDTLRDMLEEIDSENVGSKKLKSRIRSMLIKLEAIQKNLTEE